jgi:hypothetical protein
VADQRITQLNALSKAGVSATDVLPIADISASETKKVTAKDLVAAGIDLVDNGEIDLAKLDQTSVTKLGSAALADGAITATKLAADSSIAVQTTTPTTNNFEGRGYFNTSTSNLQIFNGSAYQQVLAGIGDLQVTTGKLADGAVTTAKVTALGTAAYADGSISTVKIADGAVTTAKLATDSVTATQIAPSAVGASELADNAVDTAAIQALAVTDAKLAGGAVTTAKLGDLAVTNDKIAEATIAYSKLNLANGSVPGAKIATDSITATQIGASAVGTSELADGSVTTDKLGSGAVTAGKIATDSITTDQIAPNAVGASELADNAVDTAAIQGLAVTEAKIANGAITTTKLGDLSVTDAKIANASISAGKLNLADGSVPGAKLVNDSVTSVQIAAGAVQASELADSAVTTTKIADGAVTSAKIATDSITASQVAPNAIGASELADNAVDSGAILNLAVTSAKLADDAVTTAKLGDGAVTNAKIADATIAAGKLNLADGSIPGAKIAANSITAGQIGDGAVNTAELVDAAVTAAKLATGAVTTAKLASGAVDATALGAGAVTTAKLASSAVTYDKLQNVSSTDRVLGRSSAGAGAVEEITLTAAGRALIDDADAAAQRNTLGLGTLATQNGTFSGTFSGTSSGTNTGDQTITLTGDVTGSGTGSFAATIGDGVVTNAKLATDSVTTTKIVNNAVTAAKMADNSAAIVADANPSGSGAFIGQQWINTATAVEYTWDGIAWLRQASLASLTFVDSSPLTFSVAYPDPYSAEITTTLDTQSANRVFAGPTTGDAASPTFRALVPADLPDATSSTKGAVVPGTGLSISTGTLNHSNSVTAGTATKITFDAQGHVTAGASLLAADIPSLDASKIATGTFGSSALANESITAAKLADYSTAQIGSTVPSADFIGQFFLNPLERTVYMWDGNVWQPVGITAGTVIFAGTYDANTNQIASVTADGSSLGLSVGNPLPAASATNQNYFVIVSNAGTGTSPAPTVGLLPPDLILSTGTAWVRIESSDAYIAQVATQVSFTPAGQISSTNVQAAIEEVSSECRIATNITSGTLATTVGGTGLTSYVKGDLIAGSGTNVLSKLAVGTNGFILKANSGTATGLEWATYDALVTSGGTMTGNIALSSTAALVFEGSTEDAYETTLSAVDPTADHTVSLPNASGTLALTSDLDDGTY